jgi:type IV pilus biogenesis protein CpaD/CtpE
MSGRACRVRTIGAVSVLILSLTGCMDRDPYRRTDVWRPTGANAANIAAQIADPRDLIRGRGAPARANAEPASLGIDRVQADHPKVLRSFGTAISGGTSGNGADAGSGASPGS